MNFSSALRRVVAIALGLQFLWLESDVLAGRRFARVAGGRYAAAILALLIFGAAILILWRNSRTMAGAKRWIATLPAFAMTIAFVLPPLGDWLLRHRNDTPPALTRDSHLIAYLRDLSAAQEQYRLTRGAYATNPDSLRKWVSQPVNARIAIHSNGSIGWQATVTSDGESCSMWVRDSALAHSPYAAEGSPDCGSATARGEQEVVRSVLGDSDVRVPGFKTADLGGTWLQHRADDARTGTASTPKSEGASYRWTAHVGGELRSPVAVAGNQVFVGAHGNGEFAAMSLDRGVIEYRLRVPNWVHHEPIVTRDLLIVTFGTNERVGAQDTLVGTAPSGVVAFDRQTGVERWRHPTRGSVMTSGAAKDSVLAIVTGANEAIGIRIRDGARLWRRGMTEHSAMGNPLLTDSLLIVAIDPRSVCAMNVFSGSLIYCETLDDSGLGAGLTSVARSGDLGFVTFMKNIPDTSSRRPRLSPAEWWQQTKQLFRATPRVQVRELILQAFDLKSGVKRWRVSLGRGTETIPGHIAGTPTIASRIAYVPSPINGHIVAIQIDSGKIEWSTAVKAMRGSVLVTKAAVLAATKESGFVVLDAATGRVRCTQKLPGQSDRAGPTLAGGTGILTLRNGVVMARPIDDWLACRA